MEVGICSIAFRPEHDGPDLQRDWEGNYEFEIGYSRLLTWFILVPN